MSLIGRVIGENFEIQEKVGQGGMATVYRGRQISLDRPVAIKVLSGALVDIADIRERFEQEAKIIARLTHPNIVQVHEICEIEEADGGLCIVMEYIEGRSLQQVLEQQRPLPLERAMAITQQIAAGLLYAHNQGVIHRDIKPHNVMLMGDDLVKIMDFGIARLRGSAIRTMTGSTMGTPEYMSPEQAEGKPVDHRSDLYSLAVVLYVMATGELPFTGDSPIAIGMKHVAEPPRPPRAINPAIPETVEAIILKGMAKNPSDRFDNAEELRRMLINCTPTFPTGFSLEGGGTLISPVPFRQPTEEVAVEPPPAQTFRPAALFEAKGRRAIADSVAAVVRRRVSFVRHNPLWAGAGAAALLLLIVVLALIWSRSDGEEPARLAGPAVSPAPTTTPARPLAPTPIAGAQARPTPVPTRPSVSGQVPPPPPPAVPTPIETVGTPPLSPREIEIAMRRLNEAASPNPQKAQRGLQMAHASAGRLASAPIAQWDRSLFSSCLDGFIDAIVYDRGNWRLHVEFGRYLSENADRWHAPRPVRDGLLRDARELLRRAARSCDDAAERAKIETLDREVERRLPERARP